MKLLFKSNGEAVAHGIGLRGLGEGRGQALLEDLGEYMVNESIPEVFDREGPGWARSAWTSEKVQTDGAALRRSIRHEVSDLRLRVGTNLKYARQRQLGGILKPKTAKALAVPLPEVPKTMRRPRRWGKRLFFLEPEKKKPNTRGILAVRVGKGKKAEIKPMFVLRTRVVQPPRPFLAWRPADLAWMQKRLVRHLLAGK